MDKVYRVRGVGSYGDASFNIEASTMVEAPYIQMSFINQYGDAVTWYPSRDQLLSLREHLNKLIEDFFPSGPDDSNRVDSAVRDR
jgi:hypothetical protein